jgi:hypothetical protein
MQGKNPCLTSIGGENTSQALHHFVGNKISNWAYLHIFDVLTKK